MVYNRGMVQRMTTEEKRTAIAVFAGMVAVAAVVAVAIRGGKAKQ